MRRNESNRPEAKRIRFWGKNKTSDGLIRLEAGRVDPTLFETVRPETKRTDAARADLKRHDATRFYPNGNETNPFLEQPMKQFEHVPSMAPWTSALIGLLKSETADTIPVAVLDETASGPVSPGCKRYPALNTAIRHVERYYGIVWRWQKAVGIRRLVDGEKSEDTKGRTRRIHRAAVRNTRILGTIDLNKLPSDKRQEVVGQATLAAIVSLSTKPSNVKQIEGVAPESVDLRKMLEPLR